MNQKHVQKRSRTLERELVAFSAHIGAISPKLCLFSISYNDILIHSIF